MATYKLGVTKFKRYCSFLKRCLSFMNTQLILVNDLVVPAHRFHQNGYETISNTNGCHIGRHLFEGTNFSMLQDATYITSTTLSDDLDAIAKRSGIKNVEYTVSETSIFITIDETSILIATRIPEQTDVILTFKTQRLYFDDVVNSVMSCKDGNRLITTSKTDDIVPKLLSGNTIPIPCTHDDGLIVRLNKNMFKCLTTSKTSLKFEYITKPVIDGNKLPFIVLHVWYKNDIEMIHGYSFGNMESS